MLKLGLEVAPAIRQFDGMHFVQRKNERSGKISIAAAENAPTTPYRSLANGGTIDVSWLPFCAEKYVISGNLSDYVMTEIPIVTAGVPNRNLDAFPFKALTEFNPNVGRIAYATFIGKPTHMDHDNRDPRKAKGVIFDARMVQGSDGQYKVHILAGWDRTKDRNLVDAIVRKERTGHSMGCIVGHTMCSIPNCGMISPDGRIMCAHLEGGIGKGRKFQINGRLHLAYELCMDLNYIESSSVGDPADYEAHQSWARD